MIVRPYGDHAVLVETDSAAAARRLRGRLVEHSIGDDYIVGWASLLVLGESVALSRALAANLGVLVDNDHGSTDVEASRIHEVVVTYDGVDLAAVASATGLSVDEVVRRHQAPTYTVECLGFARAFPYMSGLDPLLQLPRLATPRGRVPAGSLAMAADQVGIYPMASPGGWHLLGHTDEPVFDLSRTPPARFSPGDRVRFVAP